MLELQQSIIPSGIRKITCVAKTKTMPELVDEHVNGMLSYRFPVFLKESGSTQSGIVAYPAQNATSHS